MDRVLSLFVLAALAVSCVGCAAYSARAVTPSTPVGIVVSGHGDSRAAPDVAVVSLGVEVHRASMNEAREAAALATTRVLAAVTSHGVATTDVQSAQLSFQPEYDYSDNARRLVGFVATNSLRVRVCDLTQVSAVLDATVQAAGDDARVDGVAFEITNPAPQRARARELAVVDARERAEALARSLGVSLGSPISVEELGGPVTPGPMLRLAAYAADAPSTPVSPGEIETGVDVQVRWSIRR